MRNLELINLVKHYRQGAATVRALDGVNLTVAAGEFMAVVGRSGSGKTTMLDLVGLLMRPTSGQVVIDGEDTGRLGDRRRTEIRGRRIGFVFQEYNLLPTLSVEDNVLLPLRYSGGNLAEGSRRARNLLETMGLGDRLGHRPTQLSGGQQQRVAIARALVNRPALVLGDEPTGAVDTETAAQLVSAMRHLNHDEGVSFVLVTHDLDLAYQTDRVVRLRDGVIVSDERRPDTLAAAS